MSSAAELEASEILQSLRVERIQRKKYNLTASIEKKNTSIVDDDNREVRADNIQFDHNLQLDENTVQDSRNDNIDIETNYEDEDEICIDLEKERSEDKITSTHDNIGDSSEDEEDTPETVDKRLRQSCECRGNCYKDMDADEVYKHRLNIAELTKCEHDMYLMGVTMACMANSKKTSRQKERQRQRASYVFQGKKVCLDAFLFLENVTAYQIKRIRHHVLNHGVIPRKHGNLGKKPHNTFSLDMYKNVEEYVRKYLHNYVTDFNKNQIVYGVTRADVYNSYKDHGRKPDEKLMGYSTFRHFMKKQFPQIKFQKIDPLGKHNHITNKETVTPKRRNRSIHSNTKFEPNIIKIVPANTEYANECGSDIEYVHIDPVILEDV